MSGRLRFCRRCRFSASTSYNCRFRRSISASFATRAQSGRDANLVRELGAGQNVVCWIVDRSSIGESSEAEGFGCGGHARVSHQIGVYRVVESPLRFSHVSKTELVHEAIADGPGVTQVPLLETLFDVGSEARHVRTSSLEIVKRVGRELIREVVISAELLLAVDSVIDADGGLIGAVLAGLNSLEKTIGGICPRNKSEQINLDGILITDRTSPAERTVIEPILRDLLRQYEERGAAGEPASKPPPR